jgi:hypothetical protein
MALMVSRWDFPSREISVPVQLWQGEQDTFGARPAMASYLHQAFGGSSLFLRGRDGHLSIPYDHAEEILTTLLASE